MFEWLTRIDISILEAIRDNLTSAAMDTVMPLVTHLGDSALIFIAFGIVLMISPKYRKYGLAIILASVLCYIIGNLAIKPLVGRLRPFEMDPSILLIIDPPAGYSFPSGHAMSSFAWAAVMCFLPIKPMIKIVPVILAFLISFSRLYLYVHYPSDVVVGAVMGILIGMISIWIVGRMGSRYKDQTHNRYAQWLFG